MTSDDWLQIWDTIRQRLGDFADQFRRVATDTMRGKPRLFWVVMAHVALPYVAALLWWWLL